MNGGDALAVVVLGALASLTQSLSGFGFSLLLVPPLAMVTGPKEAVVLANAMGLLVNLTGVVRLHTAVDWQLGLTLFAAAVVGMPIGYAVLAAADPATLQILIALTVIVATLLIARGARLPGRGRLLDAGAGLLSGILNTSTSMSGPPVVLYLHGQRLAPAVFRATLTALFFASGVVAVALFMAGGRFGLAEAALTGVAAPGLVAGWFGGHLLFHRLQAAQFRRLVVLVLLASSVSALLAALFR
ncbi:MAG: sulfite exporter TauE/SafE family protein [Dehalococcoidia bacterium]|nr:sulfite exporter TauE/SafE family protein [Dehalococcoidia bacterium]